MRKNVNLNKNWLFSKTAEVPADLPSGWEEISLPHTWNAVDGQDGGNDYWRGTAVYCKEFERPTLESGGRAVLEFLAQQFRREHAQRKEAQRHQIVQHRTPVALDQLHAAQHDVAGLCIGKHLAAI